MLCKISDLLIEVPEAGGMASRCREYQTTETSEADITIDAEEYVNEKWGKYPLPVAAYMNSGIQFYRGLLHHSGMMLHASAVAVDGKAYLFSGTSGVGKSTHTRLWLAMLGDRAKVFNDDKPALRYLDGVWYAYGTPWCGKDGINSNMKVPVAGICFLKQGTENSIRRLSPKEASVRVISQTIRRFRNSERLDLMLGLVDRLVREIPIYELTNRPEPEAARLSYETMRRDAEGSMI
ncbi:MAG: hypothetical protein J6B77_07480 [Clostridia bacterium]|nr:hypothetical protein [Clostridia bacterium]